MFYIGLYRENKKKSSSLKPDRLDYWYCYALKNYTMEETSLIALHQMA